jgi:hypothetical protein
MLKGVLCEDPSLVRPTQLDWVDCLACAATWKNPCSLSYPILKAIQTDADSGHSFPSVTSLTGCIRQAWLQRTTDYYEYPSGRIALLVGTAMHGFLEHANGEALAEIKLRYTTPSGIVIHGTADLYVPELELLQDWKSAKEIYLSKLPYGDHETQINLYAYMLERNEIEPRHPVKTLQMVYISKTGPDRKKGQHNGVVKMPIEKWKPARVEDFLHRRAWLLREAMDGRLVPNMIAKAERWHCDYCPVRRACDKLGE